MISLNEEFSLNLTNSLFHKIHIYTNDRASLMIKSVKSFDYNRLLHVPKL